MNVDIKDISNDHKKKIPDDLRDEYKMDWYLNNSIDNPDLLRNAHQRIADMFDFYGKDYDESLGVVKYTLATEDPLHNGKYEFYGDEVHKGIHEFVNKIKGGSKFLGPEKRIKLLLGPVGSGKSEFDSLVRKYFEDYTRRDAGKMYTFKWINLCDVIDDQDPGDDTVISPMNQDPIVLIPEEQRKNILDKARDNHSKDYKVRNEQSLDPESKFYWDNIMEYYDDDMSEVFENHIRVIRLVADQNSRDCIETFEPKDKKNQDETELTGSIDYSRIAIYGESDPRSFDYSGALCNANRGIFSGEELLKLQKEFLYDFLHATQEQTIKPKNSPRIDIDQVIVGRTNMPEYIDKKNDEKMEAFNDRTKKIDFPYTLEYDEESKIYKKLLNNANTGDISIENHTLSMSGLFAVLTRLKDPDIGEDSENSISIVDKAKRYNGSLRDEIDLEELKDEANQSEFREGMAGISPRFIGDEIAECVIDTMHSDVSHVSPITVLKYFESNLESHGSVDGDRLDKYYEYLDLVRKEYDMRVEDDVRKALTYNKDEIIDLGEKYIDHVMAYMNDDTLEDQLTGRQVEPDESYLRSVERHLDISEDRKDSFRQQISNWISRRARSNESLKPTDNDRLKEALRSKLWEDKKHNINFSALVSGQDDDLSGDWVKALNEMGYSEEGAKEVLEYAGAKIAKEEIDEG
jgi:serine protein kinase